MGDEPILPVIQPVTIDTMLNWKTGRYFKVKNRAEFRYVWALIYCNGKNNGNDSFMSISYDISILQSFPTSLEPEYQPLWFLWYFCCNIQPIQERGKPKATKSKIAG